MLIAVLNTSYTEVEKEAKTSWALEQAKILVELSDKWYKCGREWEREEGERKSEERAYERRDLFLCS